MNSRDDRNELGTYFQKPNLPIIVWFFSFVMAKIFNGHLGNFFSVIAFGAIFTWAWLEIFQGTNIFRRVIGVIVMVITVLNRVL